MTRALLAAIAMAAVSCAALAGPVGTPARMKPYPEPGAGAARWVIDLPAAEHEDDRKLEILIGQEVEVDCNLSFFGGALEKRIAEGWGYPYFVIERIGPRASTMMACPPGSAKERAFVQVRGEGFLVRYNSKLPVVVYAPPGFEVRYRVWSAGDRVGRAQAR